MQPVQQPMQPAATGAPVYAAQQNPAPAPRRNSRMLWYLMAGIVAAMAIIAAVVLWPKSDEGAGSSPRSTVEHFMKAWKNGDADKMLSCATEYAADRNRAQTYRMLRECRLISYDIVDVQTQGDRARVKARITVEEDDDIDTDTVTYRLELVDGRWLICN